MFVMKIDEELSLKLPQNKDATKLFSVIDKNREYLKPWLAWLDGTTSVIDTKNFIKIGQKNYAEQRSMTTLILYRGEIIGVAGYNEIDWVNKITYLGYWLDSDFQGLGIMTKVARALTTNVFQELGLHKVEIRVAKANQKSRAIPERLGFVKEGTLRQVEWLYDHYVDHVVYGMLAEGWNKS
ncbi:GNAT family protein [Bacillaceae bacterium S4-13-58]